MGGVRATRARDSISGFDGLRAIAALTVVSYHVALRSGLTRAGWFAPAWWELQGGVAIFFVISVTRCSCGAGRSPMGSTCGTCRCCS
jgi:peptidoglycan/LPS O-acetylase OafA/YrhL